MLWTITVVLIVLWVLGFGIHLGGSLIHLLLVLVAISIAYNIIAGRGI